ncbi:hypothetical protein CEP52_016828 [Fusarium oligoseptatum]|uniref:LITAF domain-containing protein n=1 Tax=Fusarium oligoseptatum TaxID=2604345 RepID=A0A428RZH3_9HYPO|nr:hypothetical protein CEP52_016828 [Fusarium oligoseptatum]
MQLSHPQGMNVFNFSEILTSSPILTQVPSKRWPKMDSSFYLPRSRHDDAISPLTDSSSLSMSVSTTAVSTPTDTQLSRPQTPVHRPSERKIDYECFPEVVHRPNDRKVDYECFPEVVPSNDPESAVIENPVNGCNLPEVACTYTCDLSKQVIEPYSGLEVSTSPEPSIKAVTPLHLLRDQPDWIDCPFCETRAMTTIKKRPSNLTHIQAAFLLVATGPGGAVPYAAKWCFNVEHHCENCENRVAYLSKGKDLFICRAPRERFWNALT